MHIMSHELKQTIEHQGKQIDLLAKTAVKHSEDIQWIKENMATRKDLRAISDNIDVHMLKAKQGIA